MNTQIQNIKNRLFLLLSGLNGDKTANEIHRAIDRVLTTGNLPGNIKGSKDFYAALGSITTNKANKSGIPGVEAGINDANYHGVTDRTVDQIMSMGTPAAADAFILSRMNAFTDGAGVELFKTGDLPTFSTATGTFNQPLTKDGVRTALRGICGAVVQRLYDSQVICGDAKEADRPRISTQLTKGILATLAMKQDGDVSSTIEFDADLHRLSSEAKVVQAAQKIPLRGYPLSAGQMQALQNAVAAGNIILKARKDGTPAAVYFSTFSAWFPTEKAAVDKINGLDVDLRGLVMAALKQRNLVAGKAGTLTTVAITVADINAIISTINQNRGTANVRIQARGQAVRN